MIEGFLRLFQLLFALQILAEQITHAFQVLVRAGYLPGVDAVYRWTFE